MLRESQETLTLIQEVLDKNRVAEENFYKKYKKIVEDYIKYKFPKNQRDEDFEDCVSTILIKIFLGLNKYDPEKSSFKSWVITITKHYMCDWLKSRVVTYSSTGFITSIDNSFSVSCSPHTYSISNGCDTGDFDEINSFSSNTYTGSVPCFTTSNTIDFENCNSLTHISNQLTSTDYTLLNMKYMHGYDYCEIGREFNLSSDTVSNRVNYLKTKLKKNNIDLIYE